MTYAHKFNIGTRNYYYNPSTKSINIDLDIDEKLDSRTAFLFLSYFVQKFPNWMKDERVFTKFTNSECELYVIKKPVEEFFLGLYREFVKMKDAFYGIYVLDINDDIKRQVRNLYHEAYFRKTESENLLYEGYELLLAYKKTTEKIQQLLLSQV